ncbi:MAG: cell division protein FtsZ, partial [Flavobacteriaceae bacterium]|nr:cell division protein FtsZ [Flavobacteriaceae bacterium]
DLRDAKTVLANSGTAIMGSAIASGADRAKEAIVSALDSPLLNDNKITGAQNVLLLIVSGTSETAEITLDEIGEINEFIQNEAGYSANIIMGVGEDETLGESISVTVIATGFNVDQQAEIINTEPKKIIHPLEDEQKIVHDLSSKEIRNIEVNEPIFETKVQEVELPKVDALQNEEKIIFSLDVEDEEIVEAPKFEIHEAAPTMDLVPTSEFLKNIDVTFEVVSPKVAPSFEIITPQIREIEVVDPEFVVAEEFNFSLDLFDAPTAKTEQKTIFDLNINEEVREIKVNDPINVVPVTEVSKDGVVKYSLEDFEEKEEAVEQKVVAKVQEPVDEELNFQYKREEKTTFTNSENLDNVSPFEMTIEETLKARAAERKRKMKEFNYKFNLASSNIDEFEKVPAYKRMGVDVTSTPNVNNQSRTSLGTDSNDDLQLRSNNSFLHDNVD